MRRLLSSEHFSVDGTLIEAWASMKSFRPKDDPGPPPGGSGRNAPMDFRGEKRSNATHAAPPIRTRCSTRRVQGWRRSCASGHGLMENRSGLLVDARLTRVSGHAERLAALEMIEALGRGRRPTTLGAHRGYDAAGFVEELRTLHVRPHIAQNLRRRSAIDRRTTGHTGYVANQRARKRIEEAFGWIKAVAGLRRIKLRGLDKVYWSSPSQRRPYNLIRLPKLLANAG